MAVPFSRLLKLTSRRGGAARGKSDQGEVARFVAELSVDRPQRCCETLTARLPGLLAHLDGANARLDALERVLEHAGEAISRLETIPEGRAGLTLEIIEAARVADRTLERLRDAFSGIFFDGIAGRAPNSSLPRPLRTAALRACQLAYRRALLAARTYADLGPEHWRSLVELYDAALPFGFAETALAEDSSESISRHLARLVLLALADPQSMSRRGFESLRFYVERYGHMARITPAQRWNGETKGWFIVWPVDTGVRPLMQNGDVKSSRLLLDNHPLLAKVISHIDGLASGSSPTRLGLPLNAREPEYVALLKRLQKHWDTPAMRQQMRRRVLPLVDLVVGFDDVREYMKHISVLNSRPGLTDFPPYPTTEWEVTDRSGAGLGLVHLAEQPSPVEISEIVAIKPRDEGELQLGIVRRARHRNGHETQLGIELLCGPGIAARFRPPAKTEGRDKGTETEPVSIIFLPSVPGLDGAPALLAPSGQVEPGTPIALPQRRGVTRFEVTASIERFAHCELMSLRQAPLAAPAASAVAAAPVPLA